MKESNELLGILQELVSVMGVSGDALHRIKDCIVILDGRIRKLEEANKDED